MVRISPFDSAGRRHTSFTAVEVMPEVEHDNDIQIDEKDLKVDTYRSTGAGGQHINTTDSAVPGLPICQRGLWCNVRASGLRFKTEQPV